MNVSVSQLVAPGFAAMVLEVLGTSQLDPGRLVLEITESVLIQDFEAVLEVLVEVKAFGVRLAIDDFGTGYSSLIYLNRFPADVLKIDGVFTAQVISDPTARLIVGAVVALAHQLGMRVVAEAVETVEQRDRLGLLGCDGCQGFYFARPMGTTAIEDMVAGSTALP